MLVCHLDSSAVIWLSCPLLARSRFLLGKTGNWGHSRSWLSVGAAVATTFTRRMNAMTFQLETSLKGPSSYPPGRCIAVWWSGPASVPAWRYLQVLMIPTTVQGMLVCEWQTPQSNAMGCVVCLYVCVCARANRHIYRLLLLNSNYAETWVVCFRCTVSSPQWPCQSKQPIKVMFLLDCLAVAASVSILCLSAASQQVFQRWIVGGRLFRTSSQGWKIVSKSKSCRRRGTTSPWKSPGLSFFTFQQKKVSL